MQQLESGIILHFKKEAEKCRQDIKQHTSIVEQNQLVLKDVEEKLTTKKVKMK